MRENSHDPLAKFTEAQDFQSEPFGSVYETALSEIKSGQKESHWMWFIFPQLLGLGESENSRFFGIRGLGEAGAYLQHPVLAPRLLACCEALLEHKNQSAEEILGWPDDLKLKSSMTLFGQVEGASPVFQEVLEIFFEGQKDGKTLQILSDKPQFFK